MRLGGYILIELVVGSALATGGGATAYHLARAAVSTDTAQAYAAHVRDRIATSLGSGSSESMFATPQSLLPLAPPAAVAPPAPRPRHVGTFLGREDHVLLAPIQAGRVRRARFNRGGSSISLRLDFDTGARASFKPDQTNLQSIPRKEVAAYRVSRLLGLNAVAPSFARSFTRSELAAVLSDDSRVLHRRYLREVPFGADGKVAGSLAWWIPQIVDATIDGFLVDTVEGIVTWKRYLTLGRPIPERARQLVPQISNMLLFDFLIDNMDRFSGSNVKSSPNGKVLYFMDHALAFSSFTHGSDKVRTYLKRSQKFSRSLVDALRHLDEASLRAAATRDTGPYTRGLLNEKELRGVLGRRDYALGYIDELIAVHGEEAVLPFP